MVLKAMPRIDRVELASVTRVPEWHPEHPSFEPFPVYSWLVHHPDGPVLVDTGIGSGNTHIDVWYAPDVVPIDEALVELGVGPDDIVAVVLSHLHFDHCGQQRALVAPVHVQAAELDAARAPRYTVDDWARIDDERLRVVDGDCDLADGIRLLLTPGHTPGHQSVVVSGGEDRVVLGGQCAFRASEVVSGEPSSANLHDETWRSAARDSLAHVRSYRGGTVQLSHDAAGTPLP